MSIFAIIPAYNEEHNIEKVVKETLKLGISPIVVDDGSKDRTFEIGKASGAVVIRHDMNKGKGEAIKTGLEYLLRKHPKFEYVILMDADMQYHPKEATSILGELKRNDLVIGYRDWSTVPFRHRMGNFVWRTFFNILFGTKLKDTNCGLMGFDHKAVEKIKDSIHGGYIIENSILISAIKGGLKVGQAPVNVDYHIRSKVPRGIRVVGGVLLYIVVQGLMHRIKRK